jgi:hypothetical protein
MVAKGRKARASSSKAARQEPSSDAFISCAESVANEAGDEDDDDDGRASTIVGKLSVGASRRERSRKIKQRVGVASSSVPSAAAGEAQLLEHLSRAEFSACVLDKLVKHRSRGEFLSREMSRLRHKFHLLRDTVEMGETARIEGLLEQLSSEPDSDAELVEDGSDTSTDTLTLIHNVPLGGPDTELDRDLDSYIEEDHTEELSAPNLHFRLEEPWVHCEICLAYFPFWCPSATPIICNPCGSLLEGFL